MPFQAYAACNDYNWERTVGTSMFGFEIWDESIIILSTFIKLEIIALDLYECVFVELRRYCAEDEDWGWYDKFVYNGTGNHLYT